MKNPIVALPFLTLLTCLPAQGLDERIAASSRSARLSEKGLSGPGAEFLLNRGRAAEFFVLGESHGNQETCTITDWLLRELRESGYGGFAIETGPCTTDHLVKIAKEGKAAGVVRFVRSNPFSVAFLYWQQEAETFAKAVELGYQPWGLDQEFMGSARFLLSQLAKRAESKVARDLAKTWHAKAMKGFAHFAKTGDQSKAFMAIMRPRDWQAFRGAFSREDASTLRILRELQASQRIYGHYSARRYYQNNADRIRLMKRHLAQRLRTHPKQKVLLKFGSAHSGRGYSPFDQLDIGNHAAEAAVSRGSDSFHVLVFARESVQSDGSKKSFVNGSGSMAKFFAVPTEKGATAVFDLKSLRSVVSASSVKKAHPEFHRLVFRFDALVIVPTFHPSKPLHPMPGRK